MSTFRPFRAIRPRAIFAKQVASPPYDVLNSDEAKIEASGNPYSFLRVIKPEIDLDSDIDPYSEPVYEQGQKKLDEFKKQNILQKDDYPHFYVYRLTMDSRTQTGIVGCCHFEEYFQGRIKKHELTREAKEKDRIRHIEAQNANAEPVFFSYHGKEKINLLVDEIMQDSKEYDFIADDGVRHELWVVKNYSLIKAIQNEFLEVSIFYVADGHHRTAAAAKVGKDKKDLNPNHLGNEEYNFFMAVLFPDDQLKIFDYNRVVSQLNGFSEKDFLRQLEDSFEISRLSSAKRPRSKGSFSMYLNGEWFELISRKKYSSKNPIDFLDVTYLSIEVLDKILGITDLRKDERIDFVGGIRGLEELERRVDSGEMKVAFALFPISMDELITIADAGEIMPPKTTWFEPKLRSGLFIHDLE